jgi:succinate-semialdehyde dehydrogenase/glutarate-semialdehyde dehydrogenase
MKWEKYCLKYSEVEKSAANCDFYAENAEIMLKEEYYDTPFKSMSVYDPGCFNNALNYPFCVSIAVCGSSNYVGQCDSLKHAPNVIGCAKAIENAF